MWKSIVVILLALSIPAVASEHCITVDDKVYCSQQSEEILVGGVELTVKDPADLLRAAKRSKGKLKRTGLYDDYEYIPLVIELAKQNGMEYHQFVDHMIKHWHSDESNPFLALREFEEIYDQLSHDERELVLDRIVDRIVYDIEQAIVLIFRGEEV